MEVRGGRRKKAREVSHGFRWWGQVDATRFRKLSCSQM
jgi:hypothetical protein